MPPRSALVTRPCRSRCSWSPNRGGNRADPQIPGDGENVPEADGGALFACTGCGTQWRPGLGWTPVDADGTVSGAVQAAARAAPRRAARAAGAATSGRPEGGADTPGS